LFTRDRVCFKEEKEVKGKTVVLKMAEELKTGKNARKKMLRRDRNTRGGEGKRDNPTTTSKG